MGTVKACEFNWIEIKKESCFCGILIFKRPQINYFRGIGIKLVSVTTEQEKKKKKEKDIWQPSVSISSFITSIVD